MLCPCELKKALLEYHTEEEARVISRKILSIIEGIRNRSSIKNILNKYLSEKNNS
jgi:hypothetical protein